MARYVVGDLQGCLDPLRELLARLAFDPARDRLYLTGDLVNRGPDSLGCLRFVRALGDSAVTVLGNHDLHLLAVAAGGAPGRGDTLDAILGAPDRAELLAWLRRQPLAVDLGDALLVHAGLVPDWTRADVLRLAAEAQAYLTGPSGEAFLQDMYGNQPDRWDERLQGHARIRCIINALTRLRFVHADGRMDVKAKGAPDSQATGLVPWFAHRQRRSLDTVVLSGHWSTVGQAYWPEHRVWTLDSGCVWGGCLTALNLDTGALTTAGCAQYRKPGVVMD